LENDEILICLAQMNVESNPIKKIKLDYDMLENFIEYFTGKNFEIISLPRLSGIDCFLHPELHEESVMVLAAHRVLQRIFFSAGIDDFSLSDYFTSKWERIRKIVSGIINLARFREEILKILNKCSNSTKHLELSTRDLNSSLYFRFSQVIGFKKILKGHLYIDSKKNENYLETTLYSLVKKFLHIWPRKIGKSCCFNGKSKNQKKKVVTFSIQSIKFYRQDEPLYPCKLNFTMNLKNMRMFLPIFFKIQSRFNNFKALNVKFLKFFKILNVIIFSSSNFMRKNVIYFKFLEYVSYVNTRKLEFSTRNIFTLEKKNSINLFFKKNKIIFRKKIKILKKFFYLLRFFEYN